MKAGHISRVEDVSRVSRHFPRSRGKVVSSLTLRDLAAFRGGPVAAHAPDDLRPAFDLGGSASRAVEARRDAGVVWRALVSDVAAAQAGADFAEAQDRLADGARWSDAAAAELAAADALRAELQALAAGAWIAAGFHDRQARDDTLRDFLLAGLGRLADAGHLVPRNVWDFLGHLHPGAHGLQGVHVCVGDARGPGCWIAFRSRGAPQRCRACQVNAAPLVLHPGPGDLQADGETPWWSSRWDSHSRERHYLRSCASPSCGEPFATAERARIYCSDACKVAAHRATRRAA